MNKYLIPSIVVAAVLAAGTLALLPVENVSTVHTTILANTQQLRSITAVATGLLIAEADEVAVSCGGSPFVLRALYVSEDATSVAAGDNLDIAANSLELNNPTIAGEATTGDVELGQDEASSAVTEADANDTTIEYLAEILTNDAEFAQGITSEGASIDILFEATAVENTSRFDVSALLETNNQATCTVTDKAED